MSYGIHLVCHETKQAVHVAEVSSSWFRGADYSAIVGAFCQAHLSREVVPTLDFGNSEEFSDYTLWTPENVADQFRAFAANAEAHVAQVLARSATDWR